MTERLVDVLDSNGQVLHTYAVTLRDGEGEANTDLYEAKALQAAGHGRLVPDTDLPTLSARMHQSQGGRLQPYGDQVSSIRKRSMALNRKFASVRITCGRTRDAMKGNAKNIGIARSISISVHALTRCGSKRGALRVAQTSIGAALWSFSPNN